MAHHRILMGRGFDQPAPSEYVFNDTISANTANYDIRAAAIADGWDGVLPLSANVVINSGVYVYSVSTSSPALSTNTSGSFPVGTTLKLVNGGVIIGRGGNGGNGSTANALSSGVEQAGASFAGTAGGTAIKAQAALEIWNNNTVSGGGGGGAGGGAAAYSTGAVGNACCGGGGGGGYGGGTGGTKGAVVQQVTNLYSYGAGSQSTGTDGADGQIHSAGTYGWGRRCQYFGPTVSSFKSTWYNAAVAGNGGSGGSLGSSGGGGGNGADYVAEVFVLSNGNSGGAGGKYAEGNSLITWTVVGNRFGGVS